MRAVGPRSTCVRFSGGTRDGHVAVPTCWPCTKQVFRTLAAKKGYLAVTPDLAVEAKVAGIIAGRISWPKVVEYLNAGVSVVCVLDPQRSTVTVYQADLPEQTCTAEETLTLPGVLPGFSTLVRRFFE